MKLFILVSCVMITQAMRTLEDLYRANCTGVTINGVYHDKETLIDNVDVMGLVGADPASNDFYFTYLEYDLPWIVSLAKINMDTKEVTNITNGYAAHSAAMNPEERAIYVESSGIYKYNMTLNTTNLYHASSMYIQNLYHKHVLYFKSYPDSDWYVSKNGSFTLFEDFNGTKAEKFVLDDDNMIYFYNDTGLYRKKEGLKNTQLVYKSGFKVSDVFTGPKGQIYTVLKDVVAYKQDSNGNEKICSEDCLESQYVYYKNTVNLVDKENFELKKLFEFYDPRYLSFDKDGNFVFVDMYVAVRLIPIKNSPCRFIDN